MEEKEKANRIAVGATVAGVLIIFVLLIMLIYQFVRIGYLSSEKKRLADEIEQTEQRIEDKESMLDVYSSKGYLEYLARTYGYRFPGDK